MQPLSVALRETTANAHQDAESSSFITSLMEGRACPSAFTALAAQQLVIYSALEDSLRSHAGHRLLAPVDDRRLERVASLRHDLSVLVGEDYDVRLADGRLPVCRATVEYAGVLRTEASPEFLLANHYVRYLGDLSGGQVINRLVQRHYGITDEALTFYRFDGIGKPKPYKDAYRAALDGLDATPAEREQILAQAVRSFELNSAVFAELGAVRSDMHAAAGIAA